MKEQLELRMYTLALYQLSGIQAGIQAGHSWVEYGQECEDKELYKEWADNHKTVMVMNGGSSSILTADVEWLRGMGVDVVTFTEPDLYNNVSSASFILDSDIFGQMNLLDDPRDYSRLSMLREFVNNLKFHGGR